jgi:hypothetical protein
MHHAFPDIQLRIHSSRQRPGTYSDGGSVLFPTEFRH